jgi:HD-like signal output (HDOD) protein
VAPKLLQAFNNAADERLRLARRVKSGDDPNAHFKIEKQILGFDHSEIVSGLCRRWKFPTEVTRAIRRHHAVTPDPDSELAIIIHTADNLPDSRQ